MSSTGGKVLLDRARGRVERLERRLTQLDRSEAAPAAVGEREMRERCAETVREAERDVEEMKRAASQQVERARRAFGRVTELRESLFQRMREELREFRDRLEEFEGKSVSAAIDPMESLTEKSNGRALHSGLGFNEAVLRPPLTVEVELLSGGRMVEAAKDALSNLSVTFGVYVRSFAEDTAVFDVLCADCDTVVAAMRSYFPMPFVVHKIEDRHLYLRMGDPAAAN